MLRRNAIFSTLALLLLAAAGMYAHAKPGSRKPEFVGTYDIAFDGEWIGKGKAKVSATDVDLNVQTTDSRGNKVRIKCSALALEDGRFSGTGDIEGSPVLFMGRVEEPFLGNEPRLNGQVSDRNGRKFGRFAGSKKGP